MRRDRGGVRVMDGLMMRPCKKREWRPEQWRELERLKYT